MRIRLVLLHFGQLNVMYAESASIYSHPYYFIGVVNVTEILCSNQQESLSEYRIPE